MPSTIPQRTKRCTPSSVSRVIAVNIFDLPAQVIFGQLLIGLINGSFYALLSLGLSIIFGMLGVVHFAHGAYYMLGGFVSLTLLTQFGIGYWPSLVLTPAIVGAFGVLVERLLLRRIYDLDHTYGLLLTIGIAMLIEGGFRRMFGVSGQSYGIPAGLAGSSDLGFMFLPNYRTWVLVVSVVACLGTWLLIEKTRLGSYLRASTENPSLVQAFGINVPVMMTATYAFGVALAAFCGVMAAPIYQVSPTMGSNIVIVIFAVVVVGGMGSIAGSVLAGFGLGLLEGLTKAIYPEASSTIIFVAMALVLMVRPGGLMGRSH